MCVTKRRVLDGAALEAAQAASWGPAGRREKFERNVLAPTSCLRTFLCKSFAHSSGTIKILVATGGPVVR